MSCEYCKFDITLMEMEYNSKSFFNDVATLEYGSGYLHMIVDTEPCSLKINYCPMCGRKLLEDKTESSRENMIQELTTASNFLCETALLFTNSTFADTYPEWSGVYSVGEALGEVVKQLESEVTVDEAD